MRDETRRLFDSSCDPVQRDLLHTYCVHVDIFCVIISSII